jgi:uncharacterized protein (TIGR02246 family)
MRAPTIAAVGLGLLAASWLRHEAPAAPPSDHTALQTSRSAKSVLQAYVAAWNRHDAAALDALLTPDGVHEDIAWGYRGQGPTQIKEFMRDTVQGQPDFDWRLTTIIESGPMVAAEFTWTATYTGDTPNGPVVRRHISGRGATVAVTENEPSGGL